MSKMLHIPVTEEITKSQLCDLVSKQLSWGGTYGQESKDFLLKLESKKYIVKAAQLMGTNTRQSIDKILKDLAILHNNNNYYYGFYGWLLLTHWRIQF